ncbi:pantetheine-phosphate adenylyltransferase [Epulopiscium sp. SCG-B10WGA-EpuloA2]|nr:pantetheine-phosphate adenylyltransferase [Epulopiscium sp. SCG-B10WGA-EpuloA2]
MKIAIYPGSFDPITIGHIDIIKRASKKVDKLIVALLYNTEKSKGLFSISQRLSMLNLATNKLDNVIVTSYNGLLVDLMKTVGTNIIIKGVRNIKDFEYEKDMALINNNLDTNIETFFLFANPKYSFISSTFVRELLYFNKDIDNYVPSEIVSFIKKVR